MLWGCFEELVCLDVLYNLCFLKLLFCFNLNLFLLGCWFGISFLGFELKSFLCGLVLRYFDWGCGDCILLFFGFGDIYILFLFVGMVILESSFRLVGYSSCSSVFVGFFFFLDRS